MQLPPNGPAGLVCESLGIRNSRRGDATRVLRLLLELFPGIVMREKIERSEAEWRQMLTEQQYRVTREAGTEAPFTGQYDHTNSAGVYRCVCCQQDLFRSQAKYDSGTG